jgi:signal peptidase
VSPPSSPDPGADPGSPHAADAADAADAGSGPDTAPDGDDDADAGSESDPARDRAPDPVPGATGGRDGAVASFLASVVRGVAVVAVVGAVLYGVSGVWPPLVVVESSSMSPSLNTGDLVLVADPDRYAPTAADADGVVTASVGNGADGADADYATFGAAGDVVVFDAPTDPGPPIIHRARFRVTAGEDWYARADPSALPAGVDSCRELAHCPAPHAGYVTKGDGNLVYDQTGAIPPVKPGWVRAKAVGRLPWLGWIRLGITQGRTPLSVVVAPDGPVAPTDPPRRAAIDGRAAPTVARPA